LIQPLHDAYQQIDEYMQSLERYRWRTDVQRRIHTCENIKTLIRTMTLPSKQ